MNHMASGFTEANLRLKEMEADKRNASFTLIELLVAIAIISVLVSLLLPALRKSMELSRSMACMSNLKNVSLGLRVYVDSYNDSFPYPMVTASYQRWDMGTWPNYFFETLKNTGVCYCPDDALRSGRPASPMDNPGYDASYVYRYCIGYASETQLMRPLRSSDFNYPAKQVVFMEFADWHVHDGIRQWTNGVAYVGPLSLNSLYVDGHVSKWIMKNYWGTNYDSNWFTYGASWDPKTGYDD